MVELSGHPNGRDLHEPNQEVIFYDEVKMEEEGEKGET